MRAGSYFEKSKLPLSKLLLIVYFWGLGIPAYIQEELAGVSEAATCQWNQYLRDVTSVWLMNNPPSFGGDNIVVQIDESIVAKQKYHVGHVPSGAKNGFLASMIQFRKQLIQN